MPKGKRNKIVLLAIACLLGVVYVGPLGCVLCVPVRGRLMQQDQSHPSAIQIQELSSTQSGILLRAVEFQAWQVSNEPFPTVVVGTSPGSLPEIPLPRIRSAIAADRDWYSTILTIVYFPIMILAGGGAVFAAFVVLAVLAIPLLERSNSQGVRWTLKDYLGWACLLPGLIAVTYVLAIWPRVLREYYGRHSAMIWEDSILAHYLEGGFSDPESNSASGQQARQRLVVVNGTISPVELYADGFRVDTVPARGIRAYRPLREFSRLTTIDVATGSPVDDFYLSESGDRTGILIYNVHSADSLRIEIPASYR